MNLEQLLSECIDKKASDLHLSTGLSPAMRIDSDLCFIDAPSCQQDKISDMLHDIMDKNQQQAFARELETDFGIDIEALNSRFRVNAFMQERGPAVVFRIIPQTVSSLEALNASDTFKKIVAAKQGLIVTIQQILTAVHKFKQFSIKQHDQSIHCFNSMLSTGHQI